MEQPKLDMNTRLVKFFVENSRLVLLLILSIIIGGGASLMNLRREGFPQITPKIVLVQTLYPGAAADEVESQVTVDMEAALKDGKGVKQISSTSQNSFSNVVVTLQESADIDQSVQDIQSKVQTARATLPKDAEQPKVTTFSTSGPAFIFGVTNGLSKEEIRNQAETLAKELGTIKGVKSAKLTHEIQDRIVVSYRLDDLTSKGVNLATLSQVLQAANADIPITSLDIADKEQAIVSTGSFASLDDIKNIIVGVSTTGQPIYLKDIAEVKQETSSDDAIERFGYTKNSKLIVAEGTSISVNLTDTADIIKTRDAISKTITDKKNAGVIDGNLEVVALSDEGKSTQEQVNKIISAAIGSRSNLYLLGGLQLLFIAILLFVNFQSALIAALAIPLSIGITFIALQAMGVQLNTIVLFSFILVLGLIVDPAIVMVEAIQRFRDINYGPRESVIESAKRYGTSLFIAVLTSLIVFVPFGVVSGIFGQIIKYIPITVIPALIASYFVPMALLPFLTEHWFKGRHTETSGDEADNLPGASRVVMRFNAWILRSWWREVLILIIAGVMVAASMSLVAMGKVQIVQFSSPEDNQNIEIVASFNKGMTFDQRDEVAKKIEDTLSKERSIKQFSYFDQNRDTITLFIDLKDKKERAAETEKSKAIVARLKQSLKDIPGTSDMLVSELGVGPPESSYQIQTQLFANDRTVLKKAAEDVGSYLGSLEHITRVDNGFTGRDEPELKIVLNRDKVQKAGLSSAEVGIQLKSLMDESKVTKYEDTSDNKSVDIYLVNGTKPASVSAIKDLPLVSRAGTTIKVGDIASVESAMVPDAIQRSDGARFVNVQARVDDQKNTLTVQKKLDDYLTDAKLKELGLDRRANQGDADDIAQSFKELGIALAVAVLLTYIVLVVQFRSFSLPGIMLFTIPLSFIGVFPALWLTKSNLGFLELLGVTILVGIVENVAIFLIDYANQLVEQKGLTPREAIVQATGVRFRPILLTKLVALGGLLPLAIESDFWRGLSVVIIAGIGLSGFFSLVVIPILYVWIQKGRSKIHRRKVVHKIDF